MVMYSIKTDDGEDFPIEIVENQGWGGGVQIITYESPGTNGGVSITTGRTTNSIPLDGKLLLKEGETFDDLNERKNRLDDIKNEGRPITLTSPINNNDTGRYLITSFTGQVLKGIATYIPFSMKLTEYRQANLKRTLVNLISYGPKEEFIRILNERQLSG